MKLKYCLLIGLLLFSFEGKVISAPKKKMCSYPIEAPSTTNKVYVYKKFGISIELPDNLVSMGLQNGGIDITDRGTYKLLQCPLQNRIGRGSSGYKISWADDTVYHSSLNLKENVDIYVRKEGDSDYPTYLVILRLVNNKGKSVDISIYDESPITENEVKEYLEDYKELAKRVEFL